MSDKKLTIGTSGFVYKGGRKGEDLLKKLIDSFPDYHFTASGRGWPCETKGYTWDKMQTFYQKLDIYVCTSSIEGIGYGPLEAMACGIPVVIPIGVGVFDELPDLENVYRYKNNDFNALKSALEKAIQDVFINAINKPSLRSATARYEPNYWIEDHQTIFENFLYGIETPKPIHAWSKHACIFYVAYGEPAKECAKRAIISAKKYLPDLPVVLVSDENVGNPDIFVYHDDTDIGARSVKTLIYDLCPKEFEYVLYLDADTEIVSSDVTFFFDLLNDGFEFVICTNPAQYVLTREMERPDNKDEMKELFEQHGTKEMLQFNGGVFAFRRNEQVGKFFNKWHTEWNKYGKRDQAALDRALWAFPMHIYTLGNEWNTITRYIDASITAGILHYPLTARRWRGRIDGRLDSSEAWANLHPSSE